MDNQRMLAGQRIVSDTEPELGLGIVLKTDAARVEVFFPAAGEQRQYAAKNAPLRRVRFKEGDRLKLHSGESFVVDSVEDRAGLLVYHTGGKEIPEAHLSDTISFSSPEERLLAGQIDDLYAFDLRAEALARRAAILKNPVRGFLGGRVDLLAHQMFIANEVARRPQPRVLLADEVGLGKTIEAGLILHRLHLTGRAGRVLVLLPEPLIHQWFVEMWRRFNLLFSIFDAERCVAVEALNPSVNPFLENQLIIASVSFLASDPVRRAQVEAAGWDLLVVDEAHHLRWNTTDPSAEYLLVEALAAKIPALLLLTATPQQLGPESHFARLRLLDPVRYCDLQRFREEADHYEFVASAVDRLLAGEALNTKDVAFFGARSERIRLWCNALSAGDESVRQPLLLALLDAFGTGRVMFRNARAALSGFPERKALLEKLKPAKDGRGFTAKLKWLVSFLKANPEAKVLLICQTRRLAEQIHSELQTGIAIPAGLFHEGLTLIQRDRNAAFFAEPEGARLLICSEIGSEGRNFQFAHDLVLFDLPADPELLEQRIGRLDRIGQTSTIQIHVPYVAGTEEEVLARWYHEGLGAFEATPHGAAGIAAMQRYDLEELREEFTAQSLKAFLKKTAALRAQVTVQLKHGYDRLLERSSCRKPEAELVLNAIRATDSNVEFDAFFLRLLDFLGVGAERQHDAHRNYLLQPGFLQKEPLPGLPVDGLSTTFERGWALGREDVSFLSTDHPIVLGALEMFLGGEAGNSTFGVCKGGGQESLLLEVYFLVECVAQTHLHADRFFPATPVRVLVNHELTDLTEELKAGALVLVAGESKRLLEKSAVRRKLFPAMLARAQELGQERMKVLLETATHEMNAHLEAEIARLQELAELNDHVRPEEIALLEQQKEALALAFANARPRVDALRLILRTP